MGRLGLSRIICRSTEKTDIPIHTGRVVVVIVVVVVVVVVVIVVIVVVVVEVVAVVVVVVVVVLVAATWFWMFIIENRVLHYVGWRRRSLAQG